MRRRGSIQLAKVFGIRIGVDLSWFVVLFFFIFLLSSSFRSTLSSSDTVAYLTAVASALLFFASIVLHELGHALVARRQGIEISGITLWFFGGLATQARDTETPGQEFKIAAAGPAVTVLVILACVAGGLALVGPHDFWNGARLRSGTHISPGYLLLSWVATTNMLVLILNLVPAYPLDGGRIARAIAWKVTGDRNRATRFSAGIGQGFAWVLIALGMFAIVRGAFGAGLWMIVLGLFLGGAARGAVMQSAFSERIGGVSVADIMDSEPVAVPSEYSPEQAQDEFFLRYRYPWFPVVDRIGRLVGVIRQERINEPGQAHTVGELADREGAGLQVRQDAPLEALLAAEGLRRIGAVMAVDPDGILRGIVTVEQVRRALESAVAPRTT